MPHPYKYAVLFLLLLFAIATPATQAQTPQVNYQLENDESGATKTYVARDQIVMKPGFKFQNPGSNTFTAKIDAGLLFPPTENTYALPNGTITTDPTLGAVVGSIPGQFAVSPTGAATYTIPIECPPGINEMQPNVSLVYNSQLPAGLLGRGFGLSCSSVISRVPHNLYYESGAHSVSFDGDDRFAIDGMRLITDNITEYGDDGVIYFTENNQTTKITSKGMLGDGPEYFIVETSGGITLEYGKTSDSRLVPASESSIYNWYLNKTTDNFGNTIIYNYTMFENEKVLSSIDYSGGRVEFTYISEPNRNNYYINGNKMSVGYILDRIRIKGVDSENYLKNYKVVYSDQNGQTVLSEIRQYYNKTGNDIEEMNEGENYYALNPLKFQWTNEVSGGFNNTSLFSGYSLARTPVFLDFNGDGLDDAFIVTKTQSNGQDVYTQKIIQNTGAGKTEIFSQTINQENEISVQNSIVRSFVDVNADRKEDLIYKAKSVQFTSYGWIDYGYNVVYKNILDDEVLHISIYQKIMPLLTYQTRSDPILNREFKTTSGDYDGDGKTEIIVIQDDNIAYLINYVDGTLTKTQVNTNGINLYNVSDFLQGDFDGDGKMDIGFLQAYSTIKTYKIENNSLQEIYTHYGGHYYAADVNQDGTTDLIKITTGTGRFGYSQIECSASIQYEVLFRKKDNTFDSQSGVFIEGNIFSQFVKDNYPGFDANSEQLSVVEDLNVKDVCFVDYDGDGFLNIIILYDRTFNFNTPSFSYNEKDIIAYFCEESELFNPSYPIRNLNTNSYRMRYSGSVLIGNYYGNRFVLNYLNSPTNVDLESRSDYQKISIANIKGNGEKTIFLDYIYDYGSYNSSYYHYYGSTFYGSIISDRSIISRIEDGFGNWTNISYQTDNTFGQSQPSPYFTSKMGNAVVNTVINAFGTTSYSFTNEVFHPYKGFLGYRNTSVTNPDGITQTTTSTLNITFAILLPQNSQSTQNSTTNYFSVIDKSNKRFWVRADSITERNYLNATDYLTTTKRFPNYDDYGNPTCVITRYGNNTGVTTTENYTYQQKGSWYPDKVRTLDVVKTSQGVPSQTRYYEYDYFDNGRLKTEIIDKNDSNQVSKSYLYDNYGNPTQISETITNIFTGQPVVRTSTMTYKSQGRFLDIQTNPLGHQVKHNWDNETGFLQSKETKLSANSAVMTTSYQYDILGRLMETKYPDGNRETQVLQWAGTNDPDKAKYYLYKQSSGNAPQKIWYNAMGQEVMRQTVGLNNNNVYVHTLYRTDGRVDKISDPTFESNANAVTKWAQQNFVYNADPFKRVTSVTTSMGNVSYTYGLTSTTIAPEGTKETTLNGAGQTVTSKVNGKSVAYTYWASGLAKTATPEGGSALLMEYNLQGNRIKLTDPDAGIVLSKYNGFGELIEEKQKIHDSTQYAITTNTYQANGLLDKIIRNGELTSYSYDQEQKLIKIEISSTNKQEIGYDQFGRIINVKETVGDKIFESKKEFDFYGRIKKEIYPSGYFVTNKYDDNGLLKEITDKAGRSVWKAIDENARGQILNILQGEKICTYTYDDRGFPTSVFANGVVFYSYVFDAKGNLSERRDNMFTQREVFGYNYQNDNLNRLTKWDIYQNISTLVKSNEITYHPTTGNLLTKSDIGDFTMNYGANVKPHALTSIAGIPDNFPADSLNVTYTDFKKIKTLTEGNKFYQITYGVDDQRRKSIYKVNGETRMTRYYIGDYEEEVFPNGNIRKIHYLSGAVLIQNSHGGADSLLYVYTDYQGSILALTDESGAVIQRNAYDPWGKRRNPYNWAEENANTSWILNRGYTGHEHIDQFGIINMNGRVYDPLTAMFFSPDPFVQAPDNWLNYNRYGYAFGNPFRYTDPNGEFFFSLLLPGLGTLIDAACWGALIGGAGYTASVVFSEGGFDNWSWSQFGKSVGMGAVSGVLTAGIGASFGAVGTNGFIGEIGRAISHGVANGMVNGAFGGDFTQGFASGALGSLGGSVFQTVGGKFANSFLGTVGFSSISGGIGAELSGGNFWQGAATGAVVGLLNHMDNELEKRKNNYAIKKSKSLVKSPNAQVDAHSTLVTDNQNSYITIVNDNRGNMVEVQTPISTVSVVDGSFTVGNSFMQIGSDGHNYVFDVSIPVGRATNYGLTIKLNANIVNRVLMTGGYFILFRNIPVLKPVPNF
ncbi:MAG: FG-GAP-like repeat-containing protein [Paludibacter sp.]|nr:FG-GAP-like repeat-containing protein [Paludibacter sp.]